VAVAIEKPGEDIIFFIATICGSLYTTFLTNIVFSYILTPLQEDHDPYALAK
jgi:hypothetical protein